LGDVGFLWLKNENRDSLNFEILSKRKFPVLCVMGNHDPIYGRSDLPEEDIGIGEKVIVVNKNNPFIAYLKRGKIYTIDSYKILVLGGALSIDKDRRIEGISWWKEEYWSDKEKKDLLKLLKSENEFDFVLSHTGPYKINYELACMGIPGRDKKMDDEVGELNEKVDKKIKHRGWFCGHWHYDYLDASFLRDENRKEKKYFYLYNHTLLIDVNKLIIMKTWGEEEI
jgi:Icc-related predicted phosphoesterase